MLWNVSLHWKARERRTDRGFPSASSVPRCWPGQSWSQSQSRWLSQSQGSNPGPLIWGTSTPNDVLLLYPMPAQRHGCRNIHKGWNERVPGFQGHELVVTEHRLCGTGSPGPGVATPQCFHSACLETVCFQFSWKALVLGSPHEERGHFRGNSQLMEFSFHLGNS